MDVEPAEPEGADTVARAVKAVRTYRRFASRRRADSTV